MRLHPSFILALLWVGYYFGFAAHHGWRGVLFGVFLLTSIFVCVAGHELSHGFTAQRYGLRVHDITLLPIGGVARIEQVPLPPRREIMIALAGPLLNILVAILLLPLLLFALVLSGEFSLSAALDQAGGTSLVALLVNLWVANLMLALFNLLPAFPMDGGRVLRAALTGISNRVVATRLSVALGQLLAVGLVAVGLILHDVELPLVAVFIVIAALAEGRMIQLEAALQALPVGQFALWDMGGVSPDSPLSYAIRGGPRDVAVTSHGAVVGMLWRDEVMGILSQGSRLRVIDVMDDQVSVMDVDSSIFEVHRRMLSTGRPAIPVTEGGVYRGIFTSERLVHVYHYLEAGRKHREHYRGIISALGLAGR